MEEHLIYFEYGNRTITISIDRKSNKYKIMEYKNRNTNHGLCVNCGKELEKKDYLGDLVYIAICKHCGFDNKCSMNREIEFKEIERLLIQNT